MRMNTKGVLNSADGLVSDHYQDYMLKLIEADRDNQQNRLTESCLLCKMEIVGLNI